MEDRTLLSTFLVNNTSDSGPGSLRQAILDSNAATGGTNTIDFEIPGAGVQAIAPLTPLPAITNPVLIDGESQPGYAGTPLIELSGSQAGTADGLLITAPNVTVRGLDIDSFNQGAGTHLTGSGATGDWIYGNFLGTDPTGTQAEPNNEGVEIDAGASGNLIGINGDGVNDAAERNVISGNTSANVILDGEGTDENVVAGDFIGSTVTGDSSPSVKSSYYYPPGNPAVGVVIQGGASDNTIGGTAAGVGNVISGNSEGVDVVGSGNLIAGNKVGTISAGTAALGNDGDGIDVSANDNTIGGTAAGAGNEISGNSGDGIEIGGSGNLIAGNKVGTNSAGTADLVNVQGGVVLDHGAANNTIGGLTTSRRRLLRLHIRIGIYLGGVDLQVGSFWTTEPGDR